MHYTCLMFFTPTTSVTTSTIQQMLRGQVLPDITSRLYINQDASEHHMAVLHMDLTFM